jgi:Tfp pilus assembly protein PilO
MDAWLIAVIVVVLAIILLLGMGWAKKIRVRSGEQEITAEGPTGGRFKTFRSTFRRSNVKVRGGNAEFRDSEADDSGFDIR